MVVNGLGGIGKTTLAEAYIFKYHHTYKHIAWITNNQKLSEDFVQNIDLIKNLNVATIGKETNEIYLEVLRKLRNLTKHPNLLIIDNADSSLEEYLHQLPSQPHWHLLVTSRQNIKNMHPKELGFLSAKDAIKLFKKHCTLITNTKEIAALVSTLDYHTLSIEILAKTAQRKRTPIPTLKTAIENDLKTNIKTKHSHLKKIDAITSYLSSIFKLSNLNNDERWLMKQFTCLPPEFHHYSLLQSLLFLENDEKKEELAETLTALKEKGWLLYNTKDDSYKMHRIIAVVVTKKESLTLDDVSPLIEQVTNFLEIDQTKDNPIDKFKWIPFGNMLLKYFTNSPSSSIARLHNNLATVLKNLGEYKGAKELLIKAKISAEKNFGENHPTTAVSYSNLATVLQNLGDCNTALSLFYKTLNIFKKTLPKEHPHIKQAEQLLKSCQETCNQS